MRNYKFGDLSREYRNNNIQAINQHMFSNSVLSNQSRLRLHGPVALIKLVIIYASLHLRMWGKALTFMLKFDLRVDPGLFSYPNTYSVGSLHR